MQTAIQNISNTICNSDFYAPPLRVLRQPTFCQGLAKFYDGLGLSGPETIYWLEAQLFDHHSGQLFDLNGKLLAIQTDPSLTDDIYGKDERRSILRFRKRASNTFRYLLQMRMVPIVMFLHFGREIYFSRTSEGCAND